MLTIFGPTCTHLNEQCLGGLVVGADDIGKCFQFPPIEARVVEQVAEELSPGLNSMPPLSLAKAGYENLPSKRCHRTDDRAKEPSWRARHDPLPFRLLTCGCWLAGPGLPPSDQTIWRES